MAIQLKELKAGDIFYFEGAPQNTYTKVSGHIVKGYEKSPYTAPEAYLTSDLNVRYDCGNSTVIRLFSK